MLDILASLYMMKYLITEFISFRVFIIYIYIYIYIYIFIYFHVGSEEDVLNFFEEFFLHINALNGMEIDL